MRDLVNREDVDEKTKENFGEHEYFMTHDELSKRRKQNLLNRCFEAKMDLMLTRLTVKRKDMEAAKKIEEEEIKKREHEL